MIDKVNEKIAKKENVFTICADILSGSQRLDSIGVIYSSMVLHHSNNIEVVGFVTALSDGINSSFIPLLEILPAYKKQGIGTSLMCKILQKLDAITNVDLTCDTGMQTFYERCNMLKIKRIGFEKIPVTECFCCGYCVEQMIEQTDNETMKSNEDENSIIRKAKMLPISVCFKARKL